MIRPNSTRSKSPDSEDDEDIYSKIANQTKSTTPPDSTSIYEPLIAESQNKVRCMIKLFFIVYVMVKQPQRLNSIVTNLIVEFT